MNLSLDFGCEKECQYVLKHADAFKEISSIPDKSVDLVVLDPDYQNWGEYIDNGLLNHSMRVLKDSGNLLCFTKQPFDNKLRNEIDAVFRREIIWSFTNGGAWVSNKMPLVSFQKIYWCTKTKKFFFTPRTGVSYSDNTKAFKRKNKVFDGYNADGKSFEPSEDGVWIRDHLHYNKPHTGAIPAKPIELLEIFTRCFCPEGGTVFDPFAGSGNVAQACINTGRKYIGFEIDESRVDFALNRITHPLKSENLEVR